MRKRNFLISLLAIVCGLSALALTSGSQLESALSPKSQKKASGMVTLTVVVDPAGAGTVANNPRKIFAGANATFTINVNSGFEFVGWYIGDSLVSTATTHQFSGLKTDTEITAKCKATAIYTLTYGLTTGSEGMGTVQAGTETTTTTATMQQNSGSTVKLTATASAGNEFKQWVDADGKNISTANPYTITIDSDKTIQAQFGPLTNYVANLPAFPGCEGWGRFATGGRMIDGRGSKVYYVTRLDDPANAESVEGTLRWALNSGDDTPRTILFKVGGTIYLNSKLSARHPNVTIAGQTAPGGGICIAGYTLKLNKPNTIVRYIRFREGDLMKASMTPLDVENTHHMVFDHCSMTWSMEECLTMYDCDSTTVQWCIIGEGLYSSKNVKGSRSYATQWGGEHGTMHHCLITNSNSRSPRFNGVRTSNDTYVDNEFINNVVFNWGSRGAVYGGENYTAKKGYNRVYMISNYYRPGPATQKSVTGDRWFVNCSGDDQMGQWFFSGNKFETGSKWAPKNSSVWNYATLKLVNDNNIYGLASGSKNRAINLTGGNTQENVDKYILKSQTLSSGVTTTDADQAFADVTSHTGASLPRYDEVDKRLLDEAAGRTDPKFYGKTDGEMSKGLGIINSPYDITLSRHDDVVATDETADTMVHATCWPYLGLEEGECPVTDTDGDGLPDDYETQIGLNPTDGTDAQKLAPSGYSHLEEFLNGVADGKIDMKQYTRHKEVKKSIPFSAIVDGTLKADDATASPALFRTVQAAVDAANGTAEKPYLIFVKAGTYDEHVVISKPYTHITGQNKQNTIITHNLLASNGGVDKTATINVTAANVTLNDLTIENTRKNEGQALALYTKNDRIVVTNCNLLGWQDTYRTGKKGQRHIVRNSLISGTTDFIYNDGDVYFDADTLQVLRQSNVITAGAHITPTWGYVFKDAVITSPLTGATTALGRPWSDTPKVSFIDTRLTTGVSITPEGWNDMGALPKQLAECNTRDANGNPVDLSKRKTQFTADGKTGSNVPVLTALEAKAYTIDNVLRGQDNWDADWAAFILPAPSMTVGDGKLAWADPTGYAACFLVVADGQATLTTDTEMAYNKGQNVTVQLVSENGILGQMVSPETATGINMPASKAKVMSRTYYNADGKRLSRISHGINIVKEKLADGTARTVKLSVK